VSISGGIKVLNRYRVFKKDGTYEVASCHNRFEAIEEVMQKYNLKKEDLKSVSIVASRNTRVYRLDRHDSK